MRGLLTGLLLLPAAGTWGQESVRMSLAGSAAAEERRISAQRPGDYNLRLGPTSWTFGAGLGIEANDNIHLESVDPRSDLILHPEAKARMHWPVSQVNSLDLIIGTGYSTYVQHSEFDRFYLTPGSQLGFDIYAGDFWINLHDRFSINENNYQDPTVVGSADYSQLQNVVGANTTWDLNKVVLRLGYDHISYKLLSGSAEAGAPAEGQFDVVSASGGYTIRPGLLAGAEAGGSLLNYSHPTITEPFHDATEWNVGAFAEWQVSEYIRTSAHGGYNVYSPNAGPLAANKLEFNGVYGQLDVTHRLNRFFDYTLSGGRTLNSTFSGGTLDLTFARWHADWRVLYKINLGTSFSYEHGSQLGLGGEIFDRYGPGLSLGRALAPKLNCSLSYQFFWRGSDQPNRDYTVNVLLANLSYQF